MTQVDFYILKHAPLEQAEIFICQLTEKIFNKGHRILIHTADKDQEERLDKLLWSFDDTSFIPHIATSNVNCSDETVLKTPIHLSFKSDQTSIDDVLINLKSETPDCYQQFARIAEVVINDEEQQHAARQRYRFYQQQGCTVNSHEVNR